jgi:hypothetical protein
MAEEWGGEPTSRASGSCAPIAPVSSPVPGAAITLLRGLSIPPSGSGSASIILRRSESGPYPPLPQGIPLVSGTGPGRPIVAFGAGSFERVCRLTPQRKDQHFECWPAGQLIESVISCKSH